MPYCVTVARQTLTLFVGVRILVGQPKRNSIGFAGAVFLCRNSDSNPKLPGLRYPKISSAKSLEIIRPRRQTLLADSPAGRALQALPVGQPKRNSIGFAGAVFLCRNSDSNPKLPGLRYPKISSAKSLEIIRPRRQTLLADSPAGRALQALPVGQPKRNSIGFAGAVFLCKTRIRNHSL